MSMVLESVVKLVNFISNYWTFIFIIFLAVLLVYKKIKDIAEKVISIISNKNMPNEKKLELIWSEVESSILSYVAQSEIAWADYAKSGKIKRSEVINRIYQDHPELSSLISKELAERYIDDFIDEALEEVREIINKNSETEPLDD